MNVPVSFNVQFNFTGLPLLVITPTTTLPNIDKPNLTGYFSVTQPDGITTTGSNSVVWNGTDYDNYNVPLRVGSDQLYQKGTYKIVFFAQCVGYEDGQFSRTWEMTYSPVTLVLTDAFDLFTPQLLYKDDTVYNVNGYTITGQASAWAASSIAGTATGTSSIFDILISGNYYDCRYVINYVKTISYDHDTYTWLTISERLTANIIKAAAIPPDMATLLGYLVSLKDLRDAEKGNCSVYDSYDEQFEDANNIYQFIRARVCTQNTIGLIESFNEFYELTHNNQPFVYINTNGIIPIYDFSTGCPGSGAGADLIAFVMYAPAGVNSFTLTVVPAGKVIISIARAGLGKGITTSATTDSQLLQIVGRQVTLPTGDITNSDPLEVFSGTYK